MNSGKEVIYGAGGLPNTVLTVVLSFIATQ